MSELLNASEENPAGLLLRVLFAKHLGLPIPSDISQADIRRAKVDWEAKRKRYGWNAEGSAQAQERYAAEMKRRLTVRRNAAGGKRRAGKISRTPSWADLKAIRAVYERAQAITRETGIPHHVDHEIPLQGKLVSGLHVHTNLRILTGSENSRKNNRFEIEP